VGQIAPAEALAQEALDQAKHHSVRVSLLESPTLGAMVLLAACQAQRGERNAAQATANQVLRTLQEYQTQLDDDECEVLYGRAGSMACIFALRHYLHDNCFGQVLLVKLAKEILVQGDRRATRDLPLAWLWHDKLYLGAAHGVVGILQTLLTLTQQDWGLVQRSLSFDALQRIQQTMSALQQHHTHASGNLKSSWGGGSDKLIHWCHGAPGHILLLLRAYQFYDQEEYLQQARDIARNVLWPRGLLKKGVGLCHGISGNALVFCALARVDVQERTEWLSKAHSYARYGVTQLIYLQDIPDRPYSLYEGMGGLVYLLLQLSSGPDQGYFPCYEFA
jgi:lantibiotic modifying enzyme